MIADKTDRPAETAIPARLRHTDCEAMKYRRFVSVFRTFGFDECSYRIYFLSGLGTNMNLDQTHPSVILLMGADSPAEHSIVRNWLEHSRFLTCEAKDIFQALEKISDFTVRDRPDVVLLEVDSPADEYALLQSVVDGTSDAFEHTIFALTDGSKMIDSDDCVEGNLAQVASRLEGMIPHNMGVSA